MVEENANARPRDAINLCVGEVAAQWGDVLVEQLWKLPLQASALG